MKTVRLLLGYVAAKDLEMYQVDINVAYFNALLNEEIDMEFPNGFDLLGVDPRFKAGSDWVLRLRKALYGLKESARAWNQRIVAFLLKLGFRQLRSDTSCFLRGSNKTFIAIVLHVDDQNIMSASLELIKNLKSALSSEFGIKDEGDTRFFVGLEVSRDKLARQLKLNQPKFSNTVIERLNLQNTQDASTPLDTQAQKLHKGQCLETGDEKAEMSKYPYRKLIGSLMYIMVSTRPDIAYALGLLSSFLSNSGKNHRDAAVRVARYIKATANVGLVFSGHGTSDEPIGYCDASYGEDIDNKRLTSGHVFVSHGAAICWKSRKQSSVAKSTVEAEYVEASQASSAAMFLSQLAKELGLQWKEPAMILIRSDSQGVIALTANASTKSRTKRYTLSLCAGLS